MLKVLEQHEGNRLKTEQAFNLIEIPPDIFGKNMGETTEEEDRYCKDTNAWLTLYHRRAFISLFIVKHFYRRDSEKQAAKLPTDIQATVATIRRRINEKDQGGLDLTTSHGF